jgi:hypothetical protein
MIEIIAILAAMCFCVVLKQKGVADAMIKALLWVRIRGQHLSFGRAGKATDGEPRSEPDWGKPTVRDRRD